LKEAANALPVDATIAEHLGDAYTKAGMTREAVEIYTKALKLNPGGNNTLQKKIDGLTREKKP
jgi:predicted negative regulator of RcsB-dependent stress response